MKVLEYIGWYGYDRIIGVSYHTENDHFHLLRFLRSEDDWNFEGQATHLSREELIREIGRFPAWPICIFIEFPGLVIREIPLQTQDIFSAVLGVQIEDRSTFVAQQVPLENEQLSVALVRRDKLVVAYESLAEITERIVGLSFHPGVVWPLEELDSIDTKILPAVGAVVQHAQARGKDLIGWEEPTVKDQQFSQYLKLLKIGGLALGILVFLLLLGGLAFFWLNMENDQSEEIISQHQTVLTKLADQQYEIQQHQDFLDKTEKSNELTSSRLTYILDQVLSQLPSDVFLNKYLCFPEEKELRKWVPEQKGKDIIGDIWISGWAKESASLAAFLSGLSELSLIEEVYMNSSTYGYTNKRYEFVLSIKLEHE